MRKLIYFLVLSLGLALVTPSQSYAQDSTCQIFGDGGSSNILLNNTKRFYTKYVPGAVYSWTIIGGNISIVGPRNLHYVDVYGTGCGPAQLCVTYSIDGQPPCCTCINVLVIGCDPPPDPCCINYVNSTMQFPNIKVKFQTCSPGITSAKLFRLWGSSYIEIDFDTNPSGYNQNYTYNLDINWNLWPFGCNEIFCLKICGYKNGVECCTSNFAIQTDCDATQTYFTGVHDISYPGCNAPGGGGGGGIDPVRPAQSQSKLLLSPNPVSDNLKITLPDKNKISLLRITDRSGTIIKTVSIKGSNPVTIPVSDLRAGTYFIKADDPMVEAATFIKM